VAGAFSNRRWPLWASKREFCSRLRFVIVGPTLGSASAGASPCPVSGQQASLCSRVSGRSSYQGESMKILTASQMQRIDRITTERYGVPSLTLMEHAGRGVADFLSERFNPLKQHKICILCGHGNNGGDGFVVARLLRAQDLRPRILLFGEPTTLKGDAAINYERLAASGPPEVVRDVSAWKDIRQSLEGTTLFVDALLGTGLSRSVQGLILDVVRDLNRAFPLASKVAVDLPTGLTADSGELIGECVHADASVTFTAPKYAHVFPPACEEVGEWTMVDIGTPPEALENDPDLFLRLIRPDEITWLKARRGIDSHKGTYGHVLVIAGSFGKTGAAAMAAKAALRAGAGLVTVATPKSALPIVAGLGMEWMTEPLPETETGTVSMRALDDGKLDDLVRGKSVVALGPGLGDVPETAELIRTFANRVKVPLVLDADGLNAFAGRIDDLDAQNRVRVLTPHPGEMARLCGAPTTEVQNRRVEIARSFAMGRQIHLVLKGARTLIASPDGQVAVNPTGNPGMATGGTGDCLTGIIAGLLAQYHERPVADVVQAGVYLHGLAGDLAAREMGEHSMLAGDLLAALPDAFLSL
jgi:ADP-dependent NAD(P)H-hydrate dehydratase / NAD(P)H-hydrate epimerase